VACEKLGTCIFFNDQMEQMPAVAALLKNQFCNGSFADCARYQVAAVLGGSAVPPNLFPNDHERARRLVSPSETNRDL
jgi:hypothetical protein